MRLIRTILCIALVVSPSLLFAQSYTGTIVGSIKDASGAVVPHATITITNLQTNRQESVTADLEGRYTSLPLPPGEYRVEAELQGFRRAARAKVTVQVSATLVIDFTLEVGTLSDAVEVRADATALETTTGTVGKLVDNKRILELPLNTRNVYSLIFLTPGVAGSIGNNYNSMSYTVNGARPTMMDTVIDGVTASFPTVNGFTGISVFPSVDAIQEFKVLGANYPAEYGRSLGSVLNVVYKSGTNSFHGSAYEFFRDSAFDANSYFSKLAGQPLGDYRRSQFGGVAGGPIRRSRTFFMTSYEGLRERRLSQTTTTVPTLAQRQGDFSQTFAQNGQLIRIFDPFTTRANPAGGFIRDQFGNNVIPTGRMDPVARNVLQYFPLPNQAGNPVTGAQNYFATGTAELNVDNIDGRVDHQISDKSKTFVRYSYRKTFSAPATFFPEDIAIAEGRVNEENRAHNVVIDYGRTVSNTTVLNARLGFARTLFIFDNQGLGFKPSSLGLPVSIDENVDRLMFPRFGVSGQVSLGGNDHRYNAFMSYTAAASLTKSHGNHMLKAGFEGRMLRVNVWEARSAGTFNFRANETQGPNPNTASSTAGFGFASFLLGTGQPNDVLIQNWKNVAANSFYWAGYGQDDWRLNSRLTLNLGLRYDLDVPRTERYNRMNYFDPIAPSPLAQQVPGLPNLKGGVVFVGVDGNSRYQYNWDTNNIAPRLGASYHVNEKTVVRGGYSLVFGPSNQGAQGTVGPFGFRTENLWVTTIDGITPLNTLQNPYPNGFLPSPGSSQGLLTQAGANLQAPLQDTPSPWTIQYNINVQRELPWQMFVEVAYVGTRGYDLSSVGESGLSLNQLDPQYMSLGSQLNQQVPNPFYGIVNNGVLTQPTVSRAQLLRPYPQFTDIIPLYAAGAKSRYNALQITGRKRMSKGLMFEGSYTFAKAEEIGMSHQDSYDLEASWALASYDLNHRFVMSYLYELPIGRDRQFFSDASPFINAIIGGWQFNGITTLQAGTPLSITANNTAGIFGARTQPNNNGNDPRLSAPIEERLGKAFDTSVYSQPAAFTFGNESIFSPLLRAHGVRNFDLSFFKNFELRPGMKAQFRVEALNAFNRVQFSAPNTSVTSSSFGVITGQANSPRQLQFGLKLLW
ncbi:MAG TPA: TonB-dependent receptor [Vicinamibacterales bacterium]|jgi:carboxypeptidase family protein/TonB-dependent receptor-like protein|nr:TonB-dependent receptor [Vicinamibacterales bacterium]